MYSFLDNYARPEYIMSNRLDIHAEQETLIFQNGIFWQRGNKYDHHMDIHCQGATLLFVNYHLQRQLGK
jgi:hypothetical protein